MKKMKKLIPVLFSLLWIMSTFMTISVLANSSKAAKQDGIVATLTCDKPKYSLKDKVAVTLTVTNDNPYPVKGVTTAMILPKGYKLKSGELQQETALLNVGESKECSIEITKIPVVTKSPKTGDASFAWLYAVVMFLSGSTLVVIGIRQQWFRKKGMMGLIICFTMVGVASVPMVVKATDTTKNFTVENEFQYGEENVTIEADISYTYEKYNKVTFDGNINYYKVGDTVTIVAPEAEEGKHFAGWTTVRDNATFADAEQSSTTFIMPDSEVELRANYAFNTYTITAIADGNGTITETAVVNYGESKTFTITQTPGYHIEKVEVDGEDKGAITSYTFEDVKEEHTIKATFARGIEAAHMTPDEIKTVTTDAIENGMTDISVTFAPDAGEGMFTALKEAINTADNGSINLHIDGVTTIPEFAFVNYETDDDGIGLSFSTSTGLKSVTFGNSVTHINENAFFRCAYLESVTISKNIQEIGSYAFDWCERLVNMSFTEGGELHTIRDYAFNRCYALETLILPDGLRILDRAACYNCSGLRKLVIPISVTEVGNSIIGNSNVGIYYEGTEEQWNGIANFLWDLGSKGYSLTFNYAGD